MQVYPGYTVRRIEEELSFREVDELCQQWEKVKPTYKNLKSLMELVAGFMGVDLQSVKSTGKNVNAEAVDQLRLLGIGF